VLSAAGVSGARRRGAAVERVLSRRGDVWVSETQRSRMLGSALTVIFEHGYGEMSVSRVTAGAGVSRRTFYDLFRDREDCFLAVFDEAVVRAREVLLDGYASGEGWAAGVRGGLHALLAFLDREPGVRSLLVVDALRAGPRVQERRSEILGELSGALHRTGSLARDGRAELPALTGEGVTGAVLGVIHTRVMSKRPGRMLDLLNALMGVVVLPYLGPEAAQGELSHPEPRVTRSRPAPVAARGRLGDPLSALPMRITYRTLLVLATIGDRPGASNRQIADVAGIRDQGQISKLLTRLQSRGLIENRSPGQPSGEPNRWQLTSHGQQVAQALRSTPDPQRSDSSKETHR
jgi:AcrR family transcriptional regulator/DNA-binding MarR family transcriptional regulator